MRPFFPALACALGLADKPVGAIVRRMDGTDQSYVLVKTDRGPGIAADHDFRRLVAAGRLGVPNPSTTTPPASRVPAATTAASAYH